MINELFENGSIKEEKVENKLYFFNINSFLITKSLN